MADVSSEYWAYNDPRWAADPSYGNPEKMKYMGPWDQVLQSTGFKGRVFQPMYTEMADPNGGTMMLESGQQYTPEAKAAIDQLRSSGYDLRWKHPDRDTYNTYWGFVTPEGVKDIKFEGSDVGNIIKPLIKTWGAGLGLAGLGAGINSLLGGAGAGANALGGLEALAGVPTDAAFAAGMGADAGMAALGGGAGTLTAADLASLPADVLGQTIADLPPLGDSTVTNVMATGLEPAAVPQTNALVPGPYQNLTPTELAQLDVATTPSTSMIPTPKLPSTSLTPLTPFPATSGGVVTPPTFTPSTLATAPTAGIMEGMVPGGLTSAGYPVGAAEIAATNSLLAGLGAGAGAGGGGAATAGAAGGGAATGAGVGAGGAGAGEDFLSGMSDVSGVEGSGVSGTGILTGGTNIPSEVLGVSSDLDKILTFLKSPAGAFALSGLGSLLGGVIQAGAAEGASEQQAEAARNALALSREMFEYQKNLLAPYQKYGTAALERLSGALGLEGAAKPQQALEMDPGYGFRLGEGMKALERMQAARGNMLSGGALKAGQRYAQDYASGEYQNAYNRLANIAGLGQTAGTQLGGAAQQFGQTAGNVMGQEANALAAGRIGRGSAYGNAIQGGLNAYSNYLNQQQQNQLFRDIFGRTAIGN